MVDLHKIHVGPGGTFEAKGDFSTTPENIDALRDALIASPHKSITIHFHGGLVSEAKGMETAEMMQPVYAAADSHALALIWETGLVETFRDNLQRLNDTKLYKKLVRWVAKRAAQRFGGFHGKGAGIPIADAEIDDEFAKAMPFADYDSTATGQGAARGGDIAVAEADLDILLEELEAELEEDIESDDEIETLLNERQNQPIVDASSRGLFSSIKFARTLAKVAFRVIRRHIRDRDHGFHCTVIEEVLREYFLADLGAWVWGSMKDKAEAIWLPNDNLLGEEQHVGRYLLGALEKVQEARPDLKLNLVGHSAGTIVICHMLKAMADNFPGVSINHVVFMAAAVRSDLAVDAIVKHPERFKQFHYYTMADQFERKDVLVPFAYSRSLLYLVSGVMEPDEVDIPIAGMMRHATQTKPFKAGPARSWANFILDANRTVLSDSSVLDPGAAQGRRCTALKHGDFDNNLDTQNSLSKILAS